MALALLLIPLICIFAMNIPGLRTIFRRFDFILFLLFSLFQIAYGVIKLSGFTFLDYELAVDDISIHLMPDSFSYFLIVTIGIILAACLCTAQNLIADKTDRMRFINLLFIQSVGLNGIVMLADIFSLYVFLEIIAVSSFILIIFNKENYSLEGSFKYLILSAIATAAMLSAIALLLLVAGDTSFAVIKKTIIDTSGNTIIKIATGLFICGLLVKGGLIPFHWWLPDAYTAAPAPVSVLLAGITTKISGIATLIRIVCEVFALTEPLKNILLVIGIISIVAAALVAFVQTDLKRMLAYSSVSQMGYIILGIGCGTPLGIAGAVFHLFNHAMFKSLLFINSAAIEKQTRTRSMDKMGGLGSNMPVTAATSIIAFLSAAGIPPLAGFFSKLLIVIALWKTDNHFFAVAAVLASIITMAYFLAMQRKIFFGKKLPEFDKIREAGPAIVIPSVVLAIVSICAGLLYQPFIDHVLMPIGILLMH